MKAKKIILLILSSLLLTFVIYPSAFIYSKDTLPDNNDTRLIAYIIGQVQQNILKGQPLHYGTYFFPDKNTLAYSETFLTSALLTMPARLFTTHPIVIFNLALILGSILTIITSFLLFEYLFVSIWITVLATFLFNFSGYHLSYLPHLQMFSLWPVCLSLYFFLIYLKENRTLFLVLFFVAVTAQLVESIFPAYLIFFTTVFLLITKTVGVRTLAKIFKSSLPFIPLWLLLLYPYYHLHTSLPEATRPIRDAAHFSLGLDQIFTFYNSWTVIAIFLISSTVRFLLEKNRKSQSLYPTMKRLRKAKKHGFYVPIKFFAARQDGFYAGKIAFRFSEWIKTTSDQSLWYLIFWFSLIMSLGPVLKIFGTNLRLFGFPIPLPYAFFYYFFPGFTGFRTPSRFIILVVLAAVIIIGFNLKPIFEKLKAKTKFTFVLLILSLLLLEADLPLKGYPVNINMHSVYHQVKNLPSEAVILELPIKLWNMPDHEIESVRSLYTLDHRHRRFGGYSGFATNSWINLVERINTYGLSPEIISELKSLGISHVIKNNSLFPL